MAESKPASTPTPSSGESTYTHDRVVVRAYPKIIFFWMTWLASLVCGIIANSSEDWGGEHLGTVWLCIFAFNLIVIAFDFTEVVSLMVLAILGLLVFAGLYFGWLPFIGDFFSTLHAKMNPAYYFAVFGTFTVIYLFMFIKTRFDYWEFRHNEVIHRCGVFADIKRYSTEDLRWFKEIPDVLERFICGSGRMIITTPREQHPIVIQHVLRINSIDERVADILGKKLVTIG